MAKDSTRDNESNGCTLPPSHPLPPANLERYSPDRDPHSERDVADYVESEAGDEVVQNVEKVKQEIVLGEVYQIWDVVTDKDRYWVIDKATNLYSQRHFPSLDYTLSFHIGLMMRIQSRSDRLNTREPSPFDEVFRRLEQAQNRHDGAVEAEDYQAVGMQLRECLISLIGALRRRVPLEASIERPQDANFLAWSALLMDRLCHGGHNKELRRHLKNISKETWQLVNWLTHDRGANKTGSMIALHDCDTIIGHCVHILQRERTDNTDECPRCRSRNIRTHFDMSIGPDGDYYVSCGSCDYDTRPRKKRGRGQ